MRSSKVAIFGAGNAGRALGRKARAAGFRVTVHSARNGIPSQPVTADLVILAVRDTQIEPFSKRFVESGTVSANCVYMHLAGSLGPSALAPLRGHCLGVGQMHPIVSLASAESIPTIKGCYALVRGDASALPRIRAFARRLGLVPRTFENVDAVPYHAACGLVANGAAALASLGESLLVHAGIPAEQSAPMLGALLRSVAENVERLGLPRALTGPVRRGDVNALTRHLDAIRQNHPQAAPMYLASVASQIPLARSLGEASDNDFDSMEALVKREWAPPDSLFRFESHPST